ncbi:uncharacterized protein LOC108809806 [Raphanus sativus]|uniref:Uncharacterized protein LOC108807059 n=1 Tax=Raphanus sativus TaxID=3726 RepID=A0A6J0JGP0_RAPSA|nr:uncharacterized protein LOC108807059 [Raphanus sativus]XP_056863764.1 uncharacterized protein LOC108809806 [Raphanus sativus]
MKLSFALFLGEIMYKYAAISSLRIAISTSLFYTSHSYSYFSDHMDLLMVDLNDPPAPMPKDTNLDITRALVDVKNHPVLIYYKASELRTSRWWGCLRKVQSSSVHNLYHNLLNGWIVIEMVGCWR